jgi:6-phosphofructokinase 1
MNAAVRAVVRTSIGLGLSINGVEKGFKGLYQGIFSDLNSHSVSGIINHGGTILNTIRFPEFAEKEVRNKVFENLKKEGIEGLVIIGGDGSAKGAYEFSTDFDFPVVLVPASIDNDLYGSDFSIGFDTAINTAIDAIDKIRDTATSHERTFIIEVMGKEKGNFAVEVALACGAEVVIIPEIPMDGDKITKALKEHASIGKSSSLIILAEGAGRAYTLASFLQEQLPDRQIRYSILGYIQRGGRPTYYTRVLATRLGSASVKLLAARKYPFMVGVKGEEIVYTHLQKVVSTSKLPNMEYLDIIQKMAI